MAGLRQAEDRAGSDSNFAVKDVGPPSAASEIRV
jgi:hypothetical protein